MCTLKINWYVFPIKIEIFESKVHTKNQALIYSFILPVLFPPFRMLPILGFLSFVVSVALHSMLVHGHSPSAYLGGSMELGAYDRLERVDLDQIVTV